MSGLGLGDYGSSDEDNGSPQTIVQAKTTNVTAPVPSRKEIETSSGIQSKSVEATEERNTNPKPTLPIVESPVNTKQEIGAALEPSDPPAGPSIPSGDIDTENPPQSPYTASRLLIRDLTMPPLPNFNIPNSPPGSPPQPATTKITKFLELKRKGVHFNEKLQTSSALRNPGLLEKLMGFAGLSHEDQYASSLSRELAVPVTFPDWAYADRLRRSQEKISKKREAERLQGQREAVEFVPAGSGSAGKDAGSAGGKYAKTSTAERVMAGLDIVDSRSLVSADGRSRRRSRSKSPRRKKSRFDR